VKSSVVAAIKTDGVDGVFTSPGAGTLVFTLDNTHSMLRSKTVSIAATITHPKPASTPQHQQEQQLQLGGGTLSTVPPQKLVKVVDL
jgi:hypothetical protein